MKKTLAATFIFAIVFTAFCPFLGVEATEFSEDLEIPDLSTSFPEEEGWIAISEPSQWANIKKGGKYYLTNDITFTDKRYMPPEPETHDITIDGNNHTVTISQNQKALFSHTTNLTMRNIFLEGDLIYQDHGGLKSPIVQWENYGPTKLTNVISRVNYIATSSASNNVTVSGVIVNAPAGSIFSKVMYSGELVIELGSVYSSAAGIVYTAADAKFTDCVNSGTLRVKGPVSVATPKRPYFSVGGICGQTTVTSEFLRCINDGSIVFDARISQNGGTAKAQAAIGGILGYSCGDTLTDCENLGAISVLDYGSDTGGGYLGGILGYSEKKPRVEHCVNKGNIICGQNNFYVGGVLGNTGGSKLIDCTNEGSITVANKNIYVGGIQGYVHLGSADAEGCRNSADIILGKGAFSVSVGGIFGAVISSTTEHGSLWIESCSNEGDILADGGCDNVLMGGLLGNTFELSYIYIQKSINSGALTNAIERTGAATGGLVGLLSKAGTAVGADFEVVYEVLNCINTGGLYGNDRVGGIVGGISQIMIDSAELRIEQCSNSGTVTAVSNAGGILGYFNESSYRSGDKHYSSAGISIKLCENLGRIMAENISGGIIGAIWKTEASPLIEVSDCVNVGIVGIDNGGSAAGIVGSAAVEVAVNNSLSCTPLKGSDTDVVALGDIVGEGNFYLDQADVPNRAGAVAVTIEELARRRENMDVLVYNINVLDGILKAAKEIDGEKYSVSTRAALENEIARAEELLQKSIFELTQRELTEEAQLLNEAMAGLKPKTKATEPTAKATVPVKEEGCGGTVCGAAAMISLLLLGVGFINKKEI